MLKRNMIIHFKKNKMNNNILTYLYILIIIVINISCNNNPIESIPKEVDDKIKKYEGSSNGKGNAKTEKINIYFDISLSMKGFVNKKEKECRSDFIYPKVLEAIPMMYGHLGKEKINYSRVCSDMRPVPRDQYVRAYICLKELGRERSIYDDEQLN